MGSNENFDLHVLDAGLAPTLSLSAGEYLIVAESDAVKVGSSLYFKEIDKTLSVRAITLVLGKLQTVEQTFYGHRFVIDFGQDFFPKTISKSYPATILG